MKLKSLSDVEAMREQFSLLQIHGAIRHLRDTLICGSFLIEGEIEDLENAIKDFPSPDVWNEWIEEAKKK